MRNVVLAIVLISVFGYLEGGISFSGRCGSVKVGNGAVFDVNSNLDVDEGGFQIDNGGTLSAAADTYLSFSQGTFKHCDYETYMTGTIDINHATHKVRLRSSGDVIRAKLGTVLDGIMLDAGVSATILGKPLMDAAVRLNDGAQLHIGIQCSLNKNIESSGSSDANRVGIVLHDDLVLDDGVILDIVGTVSFNGKSLVTGASGITWSGRSQTWYNAADLTLGGDLTLGATIVFDGSATTTSYLFGNGHTIDMNEKTIVIASNHTLRIENAIIKNLKGESNGTSWAGAIEMGSGATVEFKDVTIMQDSSTGYTINRGTVEIVAGGYLKIVSGTTTQDFSFAAGASFFNIKSNALLLIDRNVRFVYNHPLVSRLVFEDSTSEIFMNNSTFKSSSNVVFDNGTIIVDGKSSLDSSEKSLMLNSTFNIIVMPAATLELSGAGIVGYGTSPWPLSESTILRASDREYGDFLGYSVSISGDYAIVGAHSENTGGSEAGTVYLFEKNSETGIWGTDQTTHCEETQILRASDGAPGDWFGYSVGISGNYAIVGAYGEDTNGDQSGAAYIFERNSETGIWGTDQTTHSEETKILRASDGAPGDWFGRSVDISGNYAIVGARGADPNGGAYIYERNSETGVWGTDQTTHYTETKILYSSDRLSTLSFGSSVAISGNYAIIGALGVSTWTGEGYIFERDTETGVWGTDQTTYYTETKILRASDREENDTFGNDVGISGNYAIVGALGEDTGGSLAGAAYIYERNPETGVWGTDQTTHYTETKILRSSEREAEDWFGVSVSVSGGIAIVGAYGEDTGGSRTGAAYVFERDSETGVWGTDQTTHYEETQILRPFDDAVEDYFGYDVDIDGNNIIIGAPYEDTGGGAAGAAYIYNAN